jgi:hypothetical protein
VKLVKLDWQNMELWLNPDHVVAVQSEGPNQCRVRTVSAGSTGINFYVIYYSAATIANLLTGD